MPRISMKLTAATALAVAVLLSSNMNQAAAIGVVGHGTYFGRYNNPMQSSAFLTNAPAYAAPAPVYAAAAPAPAYAAPAPVYAAPVYAAPAPVYQAPAPVYAAPVPQCAPVCNPCPPPCDPCGQSYSFRPVSPPPAPVVAAPISPRYPTITGGYSPATRTSYLLPAAAPARSLWP